MTERHYTHSIVSYADLKVVRRTLSNPLVSHYAYILHDKDVDKYGKLRDPHYHIVATFKQAQSFKAVCNLFVSEQNTFAEKIKGELSDVIDYFTHKGIEEKYQYLEDDIIYSDKDYWSKRLDNGHDEVDKNEMFVNDLLSDDFDELTFAKKYGRDFIKNRRSYVEFRRTFVNDDLKTFVEEDNALLRKALDSRNSTIEMLNKECANATTKAHEQSEISRYYANENAQLVERNKELETIIDKLSQQNDILMNMIKEITQK